MPSAGHGGGAGSARCHVHGPGGPDPPGHRGPAGRGDATVNELAAPFDLTLPGISKHLKVLERCGLISRSRRAQFRPCHLEAAVLDRPPPGSRTTAGSGRSGSTSSTPTCATSSGPRITVPARRQCGSQRLLTKGMTSERPHVSHG